MRLLFISPRFLFPTNEGGKIRTANILRRMKGGAFAVTLASPAPADFGEYRADIEAVCDSFRPWAQRRTGKVSRALALGASVPVGVAVDRSPAGRKVVAGALADAPDVLVVDFPHATVLLPAAVAVPAVVFTHNVEAEIFERHAAINTGMWRTVWRRQAEKMQAFEAAALRRFDSVIAVSARDAAALRQRYGLAGVERIDTGVDLDYFAFHPPAGDLPGDLPGDPAGDLPGDLLGGCIVFTGAMDSPANIDGIRFLMSDIWPLLLRRRPAARAVIVGRNPDRSLIAAAQERGLAWTFTGSVPDIRPYVAAAEVAVIPLRAGSGTRIKAFEAMAMGRPVVSTGLGIEGLDIAPERDFVLADDAAGFADAIARLLADPGLRDALARRARALLEEKFSWHEVARQFETICGNAIEQAQTPRDVHAASASRLSSTRRTP